MVTTTEARPQVQVVQQSEFIASCSCEDFWRRKDWEQSPSEFRSRKTKSGALKVEGVDVVHGAVMIHVQTEDRRGVRRNQVMLSRGDGELAVCKHIIRALRSRAIMPDMRFKTVVVSEDNARRLARMYRGRLQKHGQPDEVTITTVNNVWIVGWGKEGSSTAS